MIIIWREIGNFEILEQSCWLSLCYLSKWTANRKGIGGGSALLDDEKEQYQEPNDIHVIEKTAQKIHYRLRR